METQSSEEKQLDVEEVILQYWPKINFRVRRSLGSYNTEWEDVASEILIDVVKALNNGKFRGESSVGTFIYVITSRRIVDYIRKKNRTFQHLDVMKKSCDPNDCVQNNYEAEIMAQNLQNLSPRGADMLYLYFYLGLTQKEIAQTYGISIGRVSQIMRDSKKSMKKNNRKQQLKIKFDSPAVKFKDDSMKSGEVQSVPYFDSLGLQRF